MAKRTQQKITSTGICVFCDGEFEKSRMGQHLKSCKQRASANAASIAQAPEEQKTNIYHIVIEGVYRPQYWMHLELPGWVKLRQLDNLLRTVWLECCGHLSEFKIGKTRYISHLEDEEEVEEETEEELPEEEMPDDDLDAQIAELVAKNEIRPDQIPLLRSYMSTSYEALRERPQEHSMGVQLDKVFTVGEKLAYTYDFGDSTELQIKIAAVREGVIANTDTILLARNIPPACNCDKCGQPATYVVTFPTQWKNHDFLCEACAKKIASAADEDLDEDEEYEDYYEGLLPVVNSPRMGVCGYTGPSDFEDDEEEEEGE